MRVLLIDDDPDYLNSYLTEIAKDYITDVARTPSDGAYRAEVNDYDAIVIDNCHSLCSEIRQANVSSPILFLADNPDSPTRLKILKDGANVCLPKSISAAVLVVQIKSLVKLKSSCGYSDKIKVGNLFIDLNLRKIYADDVIIELRRKEYEILEYLLNHRGRVVSKEEILDHVWEAGILMKSNSLEVHMRNLRIKIEKPYGQTVIKTLRGFGYRID